MTQKLLDGLDFQLNEIQNVKLQSLASDPSPTEAQVYYNSVSKLITFYNGTAWLGLGSSSYSRENAEDDIAAAFAAGTSDVTITYVDNGASAGSFSITIGTGVITSAMIANGTITDTDVAAANKDGASGTPSLRTLGSGAAQAMPGNRTLDAITAPVADVSLNSHKITSLTDGSAASDAATLGQVQNLINTGTNKTAVRAGATTNTVIASALENGDSFGGVTLATGDRVVLMGQTTGSENGIYIASASGAASRATDADISAEVKGGLSVWINEGTLADTRWVLTTNDPIVLNTTALVFTQDFAATATTAGAGLAASGNILSVNVDTTTIEINSDTLRVAASAAGAGLTGGGGSAIAVDPGTGITTTGDKVNVDTAVVVRKATGTTTGGATSEVLTHNLGTRDVHLVLRNNASPYEQVLITNESTTTNTVTIRSGVSNIPAGYTWSIFG